MKASQKINGKWEELTAPDDPTELYLWLCQYDGEDVVVIHRGQRYCGSLSVWESYRDSGKEAFMFHNLAKDIYEKETSPIESYPLWCPTTECLCGNKLPGSICQGCQGGEND